MKILRRVGAIVTHGHFVGTSGLHFDTYVNKDALFPHTESASEIGKMFAEKYKNKKIEVVIAPALGGVILSQWTAYHLTKMKKKKVFGTYTQKTEDGGQVLTRGYQEMIKNKRTLIIEDTTTTGSSVMKVVEAVKNAGGKIVGICVMVNTSPEEINSKSLGVDFDWLSELTVVKYRPEDCPMCKKGIPIYTKLGHGEKFLRRKI